MRRFPLLTALAVLVALLVGMPGWRPVLGQTPAPATATPAPATPAPAAPATPAATPASAADPQPAPSPRPLVTAHFHADHTNGNAGFAANGAISARGPRC